MRSDRIQGKFATNGILIVPVEIGNRELRFMVDTGASYCILRKDVAAVLGITCDASQSRRIITASKPVLAHTVELSSFRIGDISTKNLPFLIVDFQQELGVDGLLGMNFLRKFRFCFEPDAATLVLRNLRKTKP